MRNKYIISEFISTAYAFIITRLFYPGARLIRRPIYIRGKRSMKYGNNLTLGHSCRFDLKGDKARLFIGDECEFGDNTHIVAYDKVEIGNNVLIASKVFISDTNHGKYSGENQTSPDTNPNDRILTQKPVKIGDRVWIGENVVILPGVSIGDGCIVGANSLVNCDVPNNSMAVGSPVRIIKTWDYENNSWVKRS